MSWFTVLTLMIFGATIPLLIGRGLFIAFLVIPKYRHDPIAFGVGLILSIGLKIIIQNCINGFAPWYHRLTANPPPIRAIGAFFCFMVLWFGVIPMMLGVVFEVTFITSATDWDELGFKALNGYQQWFFGMTLLHVWAGVMLTGWFDDEGVAGRAAALLRGGGGRNQAHVPQPIPADNLPHIKLNLENALGGLRGGLQGVWDGLTMKLLVYDLAMPILLWILQYASLPIAGVFIVRLRDASIMSLSTFRNGLATVALFSLLSQLNLPFSDWFQTMHDSIRDEQYLIGRELQDFHRTPKPPRTEHVEGQENANEVD